VIPTFKPSQLDPFARSFAPFLATFNHSESEGFAAMMVSASAFHGDEWKALEPKQIGEWLRTVLDAPIPEGGKGNVWQQLNRNPFFRPHPHTLVKEGFARFVGENTDAVGAPIEFTDAGFEALARWVSS
jgi:hypothetical protein